MTLLFGMVVLGSASAVTLTCGNCVETVQAAEAPTQAPTATPVPTQVPTPTMPPTPTASPAPVGALADEGRRVVFPVFRPMPPADPPVAAPRWCSTHQITGYVRGDGSPRTYDGTSIYTAEAIVAASWNIPIDSMVEVAGLGRFRVADRGMLGSSGWIDVATWTRSEALSLTSQRRVCVWPPD